MKGSFTLTATLIGILFITACSDTKHSSSGVTLSKDPATTSEWIGETTKNVAGWGEAHLEIQIAGEPSGPKPEQKALLEKVLGGLDQYIILAATEVVKNEKSLKSIEHLKERTRSITWHCDEAVPNWSFQFGVLLEGDHEMGFFAEFEGEKFLQVVAVD